MQPRYFKYKRKQKNRKFYFFKSNYNKYLNALYFGSAGLLLINPVILTSQQIFRFRLFLKRSARKSDYTNRFFWFNAFPHLPLTKKPTGTRMGKGKGKLECWFTTLPGGIILIEFKNLRYGRAKYFMTQMTHKLGLKTKKIFNTSKLINAPYSFYKKTLYKNF